MPTEPTEPFKAVVDSQRREQTAANHTATHLLHYALRKLLGKHIEQKGSLVTSQYLRFDFSHYEKVDNATLREVERMVNSLIRMNIPKEEFTDVPVEEAKKMGAMALFGEKYGDKVRVIRYADSIELCGGTHSPATGNLGFFKIVSESAIAAGVRRIEATTGIKAENLVEASEDIFRMLQNMLNNSPNLVASIKKLVEENDSTKKELEALAKERAVELKNSLLKSSTVINGYNVIALKGVFRPEMMKNVALMLRNETSNTIFAAATVFESKPSLTLMYSNDLTEQGFNAGKDIREAAKYIQGGGGGQPSLATAGGKNAEGISQAMDAMIETATK